MVETVKIKVPKGDGDTLNVDGILYARGKDVLVDKHSPLHRRLVELGAVDASLKEGELPEVHHERGQVPLNTVVVKEQTVVERAHVRLLSGVAHANLTTAEQRALAEPLGDKLAPGEVDPEARGNIMDVAEQVAGREPEVAQALAEVGASGAREAIASGKPAVEEVAEDEDADTQYARRESQTAGQDVLNAADEEARERNRRRKDKDDDSKGEVLSTGGKNGGKKGNGKK